MKLTIDLDQSPIALRKELDQAVRFALGISFYIDEADGTQSNFTAAEIADAQVNIPNVQAVAPLPPVQAAAPAGVTLGAVETDSEGQPWDNDIHSAGKSKLADGTWKLKKGMSLKPDFVAQIKARNKALLSNVLPTTAPPALTIVAQTPAPSTVTQLVASLPPLIAPLPDLPPVVAVAGPEVEIEVTDYPTFTAFVAQQMLTKPTATKRELDKGLTHYQMVDAQGAADITALQHRPEAVMPLYQWLKPVLGLCTAG